MATVTNAEYQNAKNAVNDKYTAESIQNYSNAYKGYMAQGMSSDDALAKAKGLLVENTPSKAQTTTQTTIENNKPTTPVQGTTQNQGENQGTTVTEVKQEGALKPLSQDYYNQTSSNALDVIKNNLNSYKQSNPEYFNNYEDYKKNFSYNSRNQEQKDVLDNFYNQYQKGLTLSSTPVNDLYTQYKDGQISLADLELLKGNNPAKYAELQNQINKASILTAYDDTTPTEKMNFQDIAYQMIANSLNMINSGDYGASKYFSQLEEKMNSPEMMELQDKTTEINEAYKNIEDQISGIAKDVEKEYEGTGATKSKINAIIADRTYDLQQQLRTLGNEYNKYATQYNNRATQYQNEFQLQLQEYQVNMQARKQQIDELGFAIDLMNFETNEQKQQREWDYWVKQQEYTNGNINSKDYDTRYKAALKSVQNLLSQYEGIPMQRSAEQMASDILKAIDEGSDLGTELTKINKQIQGKPEYKYLYNNTFKSSTTGGIGKTYKIGDTEYVDYNGQLYTAEEFNKQFGGKTSSKAYNSVSAEAMSTGLDKFTSNLSKYKGYGGQCAKFVNDYLTEIGVGKYFGTEDAKTRAGFSNTDTPTVGSIAIFDYNQASDDGKNYGHVGIVADITQSGDLIILDSNFGKDGKIQYRTVNPNSASLKGFFDPTIPYGGANTENGVTTENSITKTYEPTRVGLYDKYLNEGTAPTDAKLKAIGGGDLDKGWQIFDAEVADYMEKTGAGSLDKKKNDEVNKLRTEMHQNQAFTDYNQMQSFFQKIKNASNNDTATAASDVSLLFAYMKMLDPKSVVRESEFATAQNMGSLPTQWHAKLKSAVNGKKLTDAQRTQIYNEAATLMDGATYLYNNLLDDYSSMISYGGDASRLGKKGTYYTDEYKNLYGSGTQSTTSTRGKNMSSFLETPEKGISTLPKASDVFKVNTNVGGSNVPSNFY